MASRFSRPTATAALAAAVGLVALTAFACGGSTPSGPSTSAPTVRSITPTTGTSFGGTEVTITGDKFVAGSTVTFGGTAAVNVAVVNSGTIRATTPPHAAGAADVQVSGSTGTSILAQAFAFAAPGGTNTPPVIKSITAKGRRAKEPVGFADVGETIDVIGIVEDAETPLDKLTYQWSATAGTITGTGAVVTWSAPAAATTPASVTLTLTIVETYKAPDSSGLPVDKENRATGTTVVSLHNSVKEFGDMAYDFLVLFSNSSIADVDVVLRDFNTSCSGYASERADVVAQRQNWLITDYSVGTPTVTMNFGGACTLFSGRPPQVGDSCANVPVQWTSKSKTPGVVGGTTKGIDHVSGIYQGGRWWLCASDYEEQSSSSAAMRAFKR